MDAVDWVGEHSLFVEADRPRPGCAGSGEALLMDALTRTPHERLAADHDDQFVAGIGLRRMRPRSVRAALDDNPWCFDASSVHLAGVAPSITHGLDSHLRLPETGK